MYFLVDEKILLVGKSDKPHPRRHRLRAFASFETDSLFMSTCRGGGGGPFQCVDERGDWSLDRSKGNERPEDLESEP